MDAAHQRVLAVASDPRLLAALRKRYRDGSVEFVTAEGGIEGLLKVGVLKPAVVLLDLDVPEINGLEACRQIRSLAYFRPVIDELRAHPAPESYLDYLRLKLRQAAAALPAKSTVSGP